MRLVNPLGRLSRGVAGTLGTALILNTPGSSKGCIETLEAVLDVLPHAVRLLVDNARPPPSQLAGCAGEPRRALHGARDRSGSTGSASKRSEPVGRGGAGPDRRYGRIGCDEAARGDHAEIVALTEASQTRGATLYSTLEPCNHSGRTGPCTEALTKLGSPGSWGRSKIRTRWSPVADSSASVRAGVEVTVGVRAEEVNAQLRPYLHHRRTNRPWVVLKLAATLDGRTAAPDSTSKWITGRAARDRCSPPESSLGRHCCGCGHCPQRRSIVEGAPLARRRPNRRPPPRL